MSWQAVRYVLEHSRHPAPERMVLVVIASHATPDGTRAFPKMSVIAGEAGLSRSTVERYIGILLATRELDREERPRRPNGTRQTATYSIPLAPLLSDAEWQAARRKAVERTERPVSFHQRPSARSWTTPERSRLAERHNDRALTPDNDRALTQSMTERSRGQRPSAHVHINEEPPVNHPVNHPEVKHPSPSSADADALRLDSKGGPSAEPSTDAHLDAVSAPNVQREATPPRVQVAGARLHARLVEEEGPITLDALEGDERAGADYLLARDYARLTAEGQLEAVPILVGAA